MNWSQKYRHLKDKNYNKKKDDDEISPDLLFTTYVEKLKELYSQFNSIVEGTMIQSKYHKVLIAKEPRNSIFSEKEKIDALILSDNDNELKLIPDGIHFVGVLGRVTIKAYRKVYTFNSIIEKKIKLFKEPYLLLIHDKDNENAITWGITQEEDSAFIGKEVKKLSEIIIEKLLDEVFLSD
ncbi:MAG: hypothetical protein OEV44_14580 [Spirochaetota bacterium]|nr:hypothetical protein [Spirochaetota bacterium]